MRECRPHLEKLYARAQVVVDAGVTVEAACLRRLNGKLTVTDGQFMESKRMIGSVFLVEAKDMEEAVRVASLHPTTQVDAGEQFGWGIEIRPIHYFRMLEPGT